MSQYTRATGDTKNPVTHEKKLFHETLKGTSLAGLMGKQGSGMPIVVDSQLRGKAGDTIRYEMIPHTYADALIGQDVTIKGNESVFRSDSLDLTIDEVNHAQAKKGRMTDQRVIFNVKEQMRRQLVNQAIQYNENAIFKTLSGITATDQTGTWKLLANTTDRVNGTYRCWHAAGGNGGTLVTVANSDNTALDGLMTTASKFSPQLLDEATSQLQSLDPSSETTSYRLRPIRVGKNNELFLCAFLSPIAAKDLRYNPEWQAHAYSVNERGLGGPDDLIGAAAMGTWGNVIIKESAHITRFATTAADSSRYARNLLLGADACLCGWAKTLTFTEDDDDHMRELSMAAYEIRGESKINFNGQDNSTNVDLGVVQLASVG